MSGIVNVDLKKQLPPGLDAEGYKIRLIDDLRIPRVSIPLGGECIQEATASLVDSYLGKVLGIKAGLCGAPHAQLATMWVGLPEDLGKSQAEPTDEFGVTIEWIDGKDIKECTGEDLALIPTADVHQMALFNLIIGQTDGWEAKVDEKGRLRPLDNALTFPDGLVEFQHSEVKTNMYDVEINLPHLDEPLDEDLAAKLIELDSEQMAAVLKASVPELRAGSILELKIRVRIIQAAVSKNLNMDKIMDAVKDQSVPIMKAAEEALRATHPQNDLSRLEWFSQNWALFSKHVTTQATDLIK